MRGVRTQVALFFQLLTIVSVAACTEGSRKQQPSPDPSGTPATSGRSDRPGDRPPAAAPIAGELVDIPGGAFLAGSRPGLQGRDPTLEPRSYRVELGPFRIDRLAFPNDPKQPYVTGLSREDANRQCAARGARLCTELEWERACKGPEGDRYSSGETWSRECSEKPTACASGFNVLGMGLLREWVASDVIPRKSGSPRRAVMRGAGKGEPPSARRCARRMGADGNNEAKDVGFRCCQGAPNAAVVEEPTLETAFEKTRLTAERLGELLRQDPRTKALAKDLLFFREPDAANTVIARGPGDTKGFDFTVRPLIYRPAAGTEYLVVAARSGKNTSFVVAFRVLGDNEYELESSFIMRDEPGPVAFAYSNSIRPRFHFSTCWGCPESSGVSSETGKILFREPDSVVILQP